MNTTVSEEIYNSGQNLVEAGANLTSELNQTLNKYLSWPLQVVSGSAVDSDGLKTDVFGTVIHTISANNQNTNLVEIQADTIACIIDASEAIDLDSFSAAYKRIADAKALKKFKLLQTNGGTRNETLGIILAAKSTLSLEAFVDELQHLNQQTPYSQWPDMVAILCHGTIHYAVQFPGEKGLNSFLLPSKDIMATSAAAIYVIPVITPTAQHTFNKVCSYIFAHLAIFSPGAALPKFNELLEGTPNTSILLAGYQFNLKGELLLVPPQFYRSRYLPQPPQSFKDKHHDVTFTLQYLPWQDGGVILLRGNMTLQGLIVFLGGKIRNSSSTIRRGDIEISSILPITEADYLQLIQIIQRQTSSFFKSQTK